ncbi:MAG TPA: urease accessory protein UreF, partial [Burkholderiaceae bacterium]|nr:urease accessory protein UreF [Burkholderiaceae bacterium]
AAMTISTNLVRLLQLASPTLPVGTYSYSQGLEAAIEAGVVTDASSAEHWIGDLLEFSMSRMEAPLLFRMISNPGDIEALNLLFLANRETAELRAETVQMGYSLNRLLPSLGVAELAIEEPSFPAAFAAAINAWSIDTHSALQAYLWSWLENQVMAALKAVPLGQTDGQQMLLSLADRIPGIVSRAMATHDEDIGSFAPGFAILSSKHETQYSRLFRS